MRHLALLACCLLSARAADGDFRSWAPTPPMGWNSWDSFATTVTESQTKAEADVMAARLKAHGWQYVVVDIQWYEPAATGYDYRKGATLWSSTRGAGSSPPRIGFPPQPAGRVSGPSPITSIRRALSSASTSCAGFRGRPWMATCRSRARRYHAREIADTSSLCPWNTDMYGVDMAKPGAQAYYDSVFALIASWGVDFVKVDDIARPYHEHSREIEAVRLAIDRSGRPIVLSLSPGETALDAAGHVVRHANMWRISDDFWDSWKALVEQFARLEKWNPYRGPGAWPDADMLPLGVLELGKRSTNFTPDEQRVVMTLWSIARSPLMFGGDMTRMDDFTLSLLTNDEVLEVDQHSANNRPLYDRGGLIVWAADARVSSDKYLALFNATEAPVPVPVDLSAIGFPGGARIRDLWSHTDLGAKGPAFAPVIAAHGAGLYRVAGRQ